MRFKIFKILIFVCIATVSSNLFAQQGIGTETPDKSAALEIKSEKRGLLIPRVSLESITDNTTISDGNVESLLVYNINEEDEMIPGYYYWSDSENKWIKLLVEGDESGNEIETSWLEQITDDPAIDNDQNIYQDGNVAVGKTTGFLNDVALDVFGSIRGGDPDDGTFGANSIAVGDGVIAEGDNSVAFGYQSEATAYGAFAGGGFQNSNNDPEQKGGKASGKGSFAFGRETEAIGNYSVAMGKDVKASRISSVAFGSNTKAYGNYSFASGYYTKAGAFQTVIGRYNAFRNDNIQDWNDIEPLFQVGNGTNSENVNRQNAMTILKDGKVGIGMLDDLNLEKPQEILDIGGYVKPNNENNYSQDSLHKVRVRDLSYTEGNTANDKIVTVNTEGVLRSINADELGGNNDNEGPWLNQDDDLPAINNNDSIYQKGNVAIGKTDDFLKDVALDVQGSFRGGNNSDNTVEIGLNSFGYGKDVKASGNYSFAMGRKYGDSIKASGNNSFAFGSGAQASGLESFAFGQKAKSIQNRSFSFGLNVRAGSSLDQVETGKFSFAFGNKATTEKDYSFAFGLNVKASNKHEFVFGRYNAIQNDSDTRFQLSDGSATTAKNLMTILKDGEVGIGIDGEDNAAKPTEMLDIGGYPDENPDDDDLHKVRIRDLPITDGDANDKIVVVDGDGILKSVGSNQMVTMPKFFHMPAVMVPVSAGSDLINNTTYYYNNSTEIFTVDLHQIYSNQFGMTNNNTSVSSAGTSHDLPVLEEDELIYNITYFDNTVFDNVSVNDDGELSYKIFDNAEPSAKTYMNIVFEVID